MCIGTAIGGSVLTHRVDATMGHESLETTMGYLHPETSQIKVVIDRLNQQKYVM